MKLRDIIVRESPLPDDWDSKVFNGNFEDMLGYAKKRANTVGSGDARVVFMFPYENRNTVLKIAKNKDGLKQNKLEVKFLKDNSINKYDICIPIIDHDDHPEPSWIHMEYAKPITEDEYKKYFHSLELLLDYLNDEPESVEIIDYQRLYEIRVEISKLNKEFIISDNRQKIKDRIDELNAEKDKIESRKKMYRKYVEDNYPYIVKLYKFKSFLDKNNISYDFHDGNFGWYKDKIVLIDLGMTNDFYSNVLKLY